MFSRYQTRLIWEISRTYASFKSYVGLLRIADVGLSQCAVRPLQPWQQKDLLPPSRTSDGTMAGAGGTLKHRTDMPLIVTIWATCKHPSGYVVVRFLRNDFTSISSILDLPGWWVPSQICLERHSTIGCRPRDRVPALIRLCLNVHMLRRGSQATWSWRRRRGRRRRRRWCWWWWWWRWESQEQ